MFDTPDISCVYTHRPISILNKKIDVFEIGYTFMPKNIKINKN